MDKIKLTIVMLLWGSIGVFTKQINLSPIILSFLRAAIALPVLYLFIKYKGKSLKYDFKTLRPYIISGILLGLGWTTLFYGYKNTSISSAVIIYNMCPIYVMIAAPFILKEKITKLQIGIIAVSFMGLLMVIGNSAQTGSNVLGMVLSGLSGMIYAAIVIINKKIKRKIDSNSATFVQVAASVIILMPFVLAEGQIGDIFNLDAKGLVLTIILGAVHTGVAYALYFSTYDKVASVDIVTFGYLEPIFGILIGMVVLGERLSTVQILGGMIILGSTYLGEYLKYKRQILQMEAVRETE
ncbi:MAG: DMT family transporter [Eubacteriales bacterium]